MKSIDRKLLRDLWEMRGQALAIAGVIAGGVATFVMSLSTLDSLRLTQATYYQDYRFAEVFSSVKRAPLNLASRIRDIPGVDRVETRVLAPVTVEIEGFADPVTGLLISVPDEGEPLLNRLYLRAGRFVHPSREDEVVISDAFAAAHGFTPGARLHVTINGKRKGLTVVGVALSPEYIYEIRPGAIFPDYARYGIFYMARTPLSTAYDMDGAFNDVVLTLASGTVLQDVIDRLDDLLERYGGRGAYGREDQVSHKYLSQEIKGIEKFAVLLPAIFLAVAAFLLNVVISRLISTQREQIAALKAFGYRNMEIGIHYLKLVLIILAAGLAGGIAGGVWLGRAMSNLYQEFFRFPFLEYQLEPYVITTTCLVGLAAAVLGTLHGVRRAALLPPAEAMRPEPPVAYRETLIERAGLKRFFSQPTRMIARNIERKPLKSLLSVIGIAFACAIMMLGSFQEDAVDYMVNVQFGLSQREDLTVSFVEPAASGALYELESLEGVQYGEPFRAVPARLRFEHRSYRTAIQGLQPGGRLKRLLNRKLETITLPQSGLVLTDYLGGILGVTPGDTLRVEVLEGNRPVREVPVAALVSEYIGVSAYMHRETLNRLMREGNVLSGAYLAADPLKHNEIFSKLREVPRIAGTVVREDAIQSFYETMAESILIFTFFIVLLAGTVAFGVVYNSARIALSERGRDLASLRVLGFTRGEISYILLGELGVLTLAAIPIGFLIGRGLCAYLIVAMQSELYRVPLILEQSTYAFAATVVIVSACISGLIVRRKLDHLDLVAVLKTKE
jgi:putative ABC transport system permease protein